MATKSRESRMLSRVRQWRKAAYEADKAKSLHKRSQEDDKFARDFELPLEQSHKAGSVP